MSVRNREVTSIADHLKRLETRDHDCEFGRALDTPLDLDSPERTLLVEEATKIYQARQVRQKYLGRGFFGEPAWDILLMLYIEAGKRPMNATSTALIANTSETTARRWTEILEAECLVESHPHLTDNRLRLVQLSRRGRAILDQYLREILRPLPNRRI